MALAKDDEAAQAALADWLSRRRGTDDAPTECIVTHISRVFLTGDVALKLKRARRLPFADFRSLSEREACCRREIAVNQPSAPEVYLGVAPVYASADGFRLGAPGAAPDPGPAEHVAEWVVAMRRFDREQEAHRLLAEGRLDADGVRALADRVAAIAAAGPKRPDANQPDALRGVIKTIRDTLGREADDWRDAALARLDACAARLSSRRRHGFVRRLHGDLHLRNIVWIGGAPVPFDAIEFRDDIATIDVLYDAAFPAMDLLDNHRRDLACAFASRYAAATRDYAGFSAWPLFLSLRAGVRAMTSKLNDEHAAADERRALAEALLAPGAPSRLVAVAGPSGAGKTTLARRIAPSLPGPTGAVILSSDEIRKRMLGLAPEAAAPPEAYADAVTERVYDRLFADARRAMRAGLSVVIDATLLRPAGRARAAALAAQAGALFDGLWLAAPLADRLARVSDRTRRAGADPSAAGGSDAGERVAARQETVETGPPGPGWRRIAAEGSTEEVFARAAL